MKLGALSAVLAIATAACGFAPQAHAVDGREPIDGAASDVPRDGTAMHPDGPVVVPDAALAPFDLAMCPASYNASLPATMTVSRYRVTPAGTVKNLEAACEGDHPGWTHLMVLDVATEGYQMAHALDPSVVFWVGAVQPKNQASVSANWSWFSGAAVPTSAWSATQPNDNNDGTENNEQNFAYVDSFNGTLNDSAPTYSFNGICECDGVPVPASVAAMIAQ
jgi:hypothetical protein